MTLPDCAAHNTNMEVSQNCTVPKDISSSENSQPINMATPKFAGIQSEVNIRVSLEATFAPLIVDLPALENVAPSSANITVEFRRMKLEDYPAVRKLLPLVSRSSQTFEEEDVKRFLSIPTFHPVCAVDKASGDILAFAELHCLPHLGRGFDSRLERVVVVPELRGRKLGSLICEYIIDQACEKLRCGRVDLTVEKSNARHIYEDKLRFEPVETKVLRRVLRDGG